MRLGCSPLSRALAAFEVPQSDGQFGAIVVGVLPHIEKLRIAGAGRLRIAERLSGRGIYGPPENGQFYPAEALAGTGTVGDRAVKCTTPEWLVRSHTGYQLDETDWSDVSALCERFGIPIPDEYARFQRDSGSR